MSSAAEFIGKTFEASIGEPWDFESAAGDNRLTGRVVEATRVAGITHIAADCSMFRVDDTAISRVVMTPRHVGKDFRLDAAVSANIAFRKKPAVDDKIPLSTDDRQVGWLIGVVSFGSARALTDKS